MLIRVFILAVSLMVTACSAQRSALTDELATQTHTLPFALNESCELGSIIVLHANGLPQCIVRKGTLLGKVRAVAAPKTLPSTAFDRTAVLTASASANPVFSNSPEMKAGLKELESFTFSITQWSQRYIPEGSLAFERWLSDPHEDAREERQQIIKHLERYAGNEDIYYIYEVIEVQEGAYQAKWRTEVSQEAKGQMFQAFGLGNSITSDQQGATVKISQPTPVAYHAHRWSVDRLREVLQRGHL
jgi:hypothetical protein